MERIQSAIAKARAERRRVGDRTARDHELPVESTLRAGEPVAVADRWAALTPFVPDQRRLERQRVFTLSGGALASAFDVLRTRILQQMATNNWRRLAITSPTAACGKSTVALNLAFGLARQQERRVILAELDLRRPSLGGILGLTDTADFAAVLEGRADFSANARCHGGNLAVAWNSAPTRNPSELLQSSFVGPALERIEADYNPDVVIFDQPPLSAGDDALAFTRHVDAVLIVAAAEESTVKQIDNCERELAQQTNVLGVVLNKCRYLEGSSDYTYEYY